MALYITESIAFQLLFLFIYDLLLKRETFFQWNRAYLIGTYMLSIILPWVKLEAFKQKAPPIFRDYSEIWWNIQSPTVEVKQTQEVFFQLSWQEWVLYLGMLVTAFLFALKIRQLYQLKRSGKHIEYADFTQIIIANSNIAFSFFTSIFIGDKVVAKEHKTIIAHELVHIKQGHTYDLLFFELMRIICWFNPLVYIYQKRTSELHEFIADDQVAKNNKKEHYQQLLSQVFQTEHFSFINQFFTKSLIKKRIVMLQKSKSKKIVQLKYLLLIPVVLGILFYTSCELDTSELVPSSTSASDQALIDKITKALASENIESSSVFSNELMSKYNNPNEIISKEEFFKVNLFLSNILEVSKTGDKDEFNRSLLLNYANPTTEKYQDYVAKTKAYQLLDPNLKALLTTSKKSIGFINNKAKLSASYLTFKVKNLAKLSANELKEFNALLLRLEGQPSKQANVYLYDGTHRFHIFSKVYRVTSDFVEDYKENTGDDVVSFSAVDQVPVFPGCENATDKRDCFNTQIQKHIGKNFRYPLKAQEDGIDGRVNVMFTIAANGSIQNIKLKGPDKILEDEVQRIIKKLPKMTPAMHNGKAVHVPFSMPVNFKLQ